MQYSTLGKFVESLMVKYVKGEIEGNEFVQSVHEKMQELKVEEQTLDSLFLTCNYDEKSLDTYNGIVVKNLSRNETLEIINTGDLDNDLEVAHEKYKQHPIIRSSSIDHYWHDLRNVRQ